MIDQNNPYFKRVRLLVQILPLIAEKDCFALKGGTAINFFIRNLPRLSVDIDLVYLPVNDRDESLVGIADAFKDIKSRTEHIIKGSHVVISKNPNGHINKLLVQQGMDNIKIEVSPVARGTIYSPEEMTITETVEKLFGYVQMSVVSFDELYAGKLCAALNRQHPRDLFDVMILFQKEGITPGIKKAFLVELVSDNRPIVELLNPNRKDLKKVFKTQFENMTTIPVSLDDLISAREKLFNEIRAGLTDEDKQFLLSFKGGNPQWNLLGLEGVENLPAIRWKLQNLNQMTSATRNKAIEKLEKELYGKG
ncbi:MAG: nucleotidyl transferase AbiEii/AbiGii toxin family protein [Candidatus Omnitrophica bacterium]|nr:nucleotidyl transferase AbiEii/AbiGii toxin family protein [Candidatus Omnitrophota bacterium]